MINLLLLKDLILQEGMGLGVAPLVQVLGHGLLITEVLLEPCPRLMLPLGHRRRVVGDLS